MFHSTIIGIGCLCGENRTRLSVLSRLSYTNQLNSISIRVRNRSREPNVGLCKQYAFVEILTYNKTGSIKRNNQRNKKKKLLSRWTPQSRLAVFLHNYITVCKISFLTICTNVKNHEKHDCLKIEEKNHVQRVDHETATHRMDVRTRFYRVSKWNTNWKTRTNIVHRFKLRTFGEDRDERSMIDYNVIGWGQNKKKNTQNYFKSVYKLFLFQRISSIVGTFD